MIPAVAIATQTPGLPQLIQRYSSSLPLLIAALAIPEIHGASGAQEAGQADIISTRTDASERLTVPVQIGEHGPFRFLIDTGSQNTVVSSAVARELALPKGQQARLIGVAGSQTVDTVEIDQIDLGRRSYYGLLVPLLEREHIGADGILGIDSLQGQRVLLDFDLAALYGVPTKRLNEQVRRNIDRFPSDFIFSLTDAEFESLRSQIATLKTHLLRRSTESQNPKETDHDCA